jgi:hypothetical protein
MCRVYSGVGGLSKSLKTQRFRTSWLNSNMTEIYIINCFNVLRLAYMPIARYEPVLLFVRHLVLDKSPYWRLVKILHHQRRLEVDVFHHISFLLVFFCFPNSTSLGAGKRQWRWSVSLFLAVRNRKRMSVLILILRYGKWSLLQVSFVNILIKPAIFLVIPDSFRILYKTSLVAKW